MTGAKQLRILLIDDHPLYREGVAGAIRATDDLELVGEATTGVDALAQVEELRPDVAVVDLHMPGLDGVDLLSSLASVVPETRLLVLSASTVGASVYDALSVGVAGYLSKHVGRARICDAIREVAKGEMAIDPELQVELATHVRTRHAEEDAARLTARELEILALVAAGWSAPAIGRELSISTPTVKTHLQRMYEKLGVADRASAVAAALRRGLID